MAAADSQVGSAAVCDGRFAAALRQRLAAVDCCAGSTAAALTPLVAAPTTAAAAADSCTGSSFAGPAAGTCGPLPNPPLADEEVVGSPDAAIPTRAHALPPLRGTAATHVPSPHCRCFAAGRLPAAHAALSVPVSVALVAAVAATCISAVTFRSVAGMTEPAAEISRCRAGMAEPAAQTSAVASTVAAA